MCNVTLTQLCHVHQLQVFNVPSYIADSFLNDICIPVLSFDSPNISCPHMFRCQLGHCLHVSQLCDGVVHCPLFADDETSCIVELCPQQCRCLGKAVYCDKTNHQYAPAIAADTRLFAMRHNQFFITLDTSIHNANLLQIDFSLNSLRHISDNAFATNIYLSYLDISCNLLIFTPNLHTLTELVFLNVSHNMLEFLPRDMFKATVSLKYFDGEPVIKELKRVSTPGRRVYLGVDKLPKVRQGLGVAVVSTSKGIMSDSQARQSRVGGEVLCTVF